MGSQDHQNHLDSVNRRHGIKDKAWPRLLEDVGPTPYSIILFLKTSDDPQTELNKDQNNQRTNSSLWLDQILPADLHWENEIVDRHGDANDTSDCHQHDPEHLPFFLRPYLTGGVY